MQKKLSEFTDEELLAEAKKSKSTAITNAVLIGFLAGVVFYSLAMNTWGFLTLIPLFFIYKLVNNPKNAAHQAELEQLLKERNLK
ncbi:MAG: FUSC family protein [Bacteroidota bacterium]